MRRLLVDAAVLLATIAVCAGALELGYRLVAGAPLLRFPDWRVEHASRTDLAGRLRFDPALGWTTKEGWTGEGFHTIDQGVRRNGPDDSRLRTGGILVTGDSFAMGAQVGDDESWP